MRGKADDGSTFHLAGVILFKVNGDVPPLAGSSSSRSTQRPDVILVAGGTAGWARARTQARRAGEPVRGLSRGHVDVDLPREVELFHGAYAGRPISTAPWPAPTRPLGRPGIVGKDVSPASVDRDGNLELVRAAGPQVRRWC